ncbi:MAG TPA: phospholipase D-like domain-containing protein, partial [Deltaproteobacteria bacterium]|nr:phospholipase D-like domain-containing protein [Deltaproteobacteria bacterium]
PPYVQALKAAAMDGVDVRLLVPGTTDIPVVRALSRAGYQSLLEAGVRVFEWNGPMLHAKTAVADGRWARIGSSNLNVSSWVGNYELDVAVENEEFAHAMERMYIEDLARSTEVVLSQGRKVCLAGKRPRRRFPRRTVIRGRRKGSMGSAGIGVMRLGKVVEAAITGRRALGSVETTITLVAGLLLFVLAFVVIVWPKLLAIPFAAICMWLSWAFFLRAWRLGRRRSSRHMTPPRRTGDGGTAP